MAAEVFGNLYYVSLDEFALTDPANIESIIYSRVNIGPVLEMQVTDIVRFTVKGGVSAGRKYQFQDIDESLYEYDGENGPFFSVGVKLVPMKKKA